MNSKEEGVFLYRADESELSENYVRAYTLNQYSIFTYASTDFPNKDFEQGEVVYVRVNKDGKCEVTEDVEKEVFAMRVINRTKINDLDAYTFIVSKTKDEPYNKLKEEHYIRSHLNKDIVTMVY